MDADGRSNWTAVLFSSWSMTKVGIVDFMISWYYDILWGSFIQVLLTNKVFHHRWWLKLLSNLEMIQYHPKSIAYVMCIVGHGSGEIYGHSDGAKDEQLAKKMQWRIDNIWKYHGMSASPLWDKKGVWHWGIISHNRIHDIQALSTTCTSGCSTK